MSEIQEISELAKAILQQLQTSGVLTLSELSDHLSRPRATINDHLGVLVDLGLVKKFVRPRSSRGRPPVFYKICE